MPVLYEVAEHTLNAPAGADSLPPAACRHFVTKVATLTMVEGLQGGVSYATIVTITIRGQVTLAFSTTRRCKNEYV
jgi:hypothetical protein